MDFKIFQSYCKYAKYGISDDCTGSFELTCRKPGCIPTGDSWGICDEKHCPNFGMTVGGGVMVDAKTGETLLTFSHGRIIFGK